MLPLFLYHVLFFLHFRGVGTKGPKIEGTDRLRVLFTPAGGKQNAEAIGALDFGPAVVFNLVHTVRASTFSYSLSG